MKILPILFLAFGSSAIAQSQSLQQYIQGLPKYDAPGRDYPGRAYKMPSSDGPRFIQTADPEIYLKYTETTISPIRPESVDLNKDINTDLQGAYSK